MNLLPGLSHAHMMESFGEYPEKGGRGFTLGSALEEEEKDVCMHLPPQKKSTCIISPPSVAAFGHAAII